MTHIRIVVLLRSAGFTFALAAVFAVASSGHASADWLFWRKNAQTSPPAAKPAPVPSDSATAPDNGKANIVTARKAVEFRLRAGSQSFLSNASRSEIVTAIEEANKDSRLDGLPDELNPGLVDPLKVQAFIAAISTLPEDMAAKLSGRTVLVAFPGLLVGTSSPTKPGSFYGPFRIEIDGLEGDEVRVNSFVRIDCDLARNRSVTASDRIRTANEVRPRRAAIAKSWLQNAGAWASCPEGGEEAKASFEGARAAAAAYASGDSSGPKQAVAPLSPKKPAHRP